LLPLLFLFCNFELFFHLLIFFFFLLGWQLQEQPEYEHFAEFLKTPIVDATTVMAGRFPVPAYVECDQGKSAARFLMAKLNPSITHTSSGGTDQPVIFSDDVPLAIFMEHLKKYAVAQQ
jgi:protein transport protein SEC23